MRSQIGLKQSKCSPQEKLKKINRNSQRTYYKGLLKKPLINASHLVTARMRPLRIWLSQISSGLA